MTSNHLRAGILRGGNKLDMRNDATQAAANAGAWGAELRPRRALTLLTLGSILALAPLLTSCDRPSAESADTESASGAVNTSNSGTPLAPGVASNSASGPGSAGRLPASLSPPASGPSTPPGPDYRIDATRDWFHFSSVKCGTPAGDWVLTVDGTRELGGGRLVASGSGLVTLDGATLRGPWSAQYAIRLEGVPATVGGQDATVSGNAELVDDVLQIRSQVGQGTFFSRTPALGLGGAAEDPRRDFDLPVQSGRFC